MIVCLKNRNKYLKGSGNLVSESSSFKSTLKACISLLGEGSLMLKMLSLIRHTVKPSSTSSLHLTSKLPSVFQLPKLLIASIFLNRCSDSQS